MPYGREALNEALELLHGFYRSSVVLWRSQDCGDWSSMAKLYDIEQQWNQVSTGKTFTYTMCFYASIVLEGSRCIKDICSFA